MLSTKKYGYRILIREFEKDPDQAGVLAENVGNALEKLHKISNTEEQPLAVFAAEISGNPHYFDRGTTAGRFWSGESAVSERRKFRRMLTSGES